MIDVETTKPLVRTVAEACKVLRMSRTSLYSAIQRGQVRIVKLNRSTRIPQAEVERIAREGLGLERIVIDTHDPFSARWRARNDR